ncbi:hypothetical protein LY78DRAFT_530095, partial [Colletotrichum sublineola]
SQLEIQSNTLQSAFRDISKRITSINLDQDPITIPEPYVEIFHCQSRIQATIDTITDGPLREELQLLKRFPEEYMRTTLKNLQSQNTRESVEFELIPFVFVLGSLVI